ncbi:MAG: hypothetical protein HWD61_08350 [Parachlamydiaceae bacterium]|nr:MAG: hypothetical protein HWD61_08350 [Parachlamydiaceae bacterium]
MFLQFPSPFVVGKRLTPRMWAVLRDSQALTFKLTFFNWGTLDAEGINTFT